MISYRYYWGKEPLPSAQGANAEDILKQLSDMLLRENDISKALDLLKQQGMKPSDDCQGMQGIHDFLEQVRRLKQKLQESMSPSDPSALEELKSAAQSTENLMQPILKAVKERATLGEICNILRQVFGEYTHASRC